MTPNQLCAETTPTLLENDQRRGANRRVEPVRVAKAEIAGRAPGVEAALLRGEGAGAVVGRGAGQDRRVHVGPADDRERVLVPVTERVGEGELEPAAEPGVVDQLAAGAVGVVGRAHER